MENCNDGNARVNDPNSKPNNFDISTRFSSKSNTFVFYYFVPERKAVKSFPDSTSDDKSTVQK